MLVMIAFRNFFLSLDNNPETISKNFGFKILGSRLRFEVVVLQWRRGA